MVEGVQRFCYFAPQQRAPMIIANYNCTKYNKKTFEEYREKCIPNVKSFVQKDMKIDGEST